MAKRAAGLTLKLRVKTLPFHYVMKFNIIYIMRNKRRVRKAPSKVKIDLSFLVQNLIGFA